MRAGRPFRRALLGGAVTLTARAAGAQPMGHQLSPAEAEYQPRPKGLAMCAVCTLFVRPNLCKAVAGEVSLEGWCKLFDMVD
jgi:hypothetical protein